MKYGKNYYYVYYSYEEWGRGYIGHRGCNCAPEEDIKYMGSFTDKTFKPTKKIILQIFATKEEAILAEIILHDFYEVHVNPHFANRAKQRVLGFYYTHNSKEIELKRRERISKKMKGIKHSLQSRENRSGSKSNCWGKRWWNNGNEQKLLESKPEGPEWVRGCLPLTKERKNAMREMHLGKRWWTDGVSTRHCRECPGEFWYRKYPKSKN